MSKVMFLASIEIVGKERECDRHFADKREKIRGLFDIGWVTGSRDALSTEKGVAFYSFKVEIDRKDAPTAISILKELGFKTMYV